MPSRAPLHRLPVLVAGAVALLALAPVPAGAANAGPALVPAGVTIGTVDVSGLTREAAVAVVKHAFLRAPLVIDLGRSTVTVPPIRFAVALGNVEAVVDLALARTEPGAVAIPVAYDPDRVVVFVRHAAQAVRRAPRDAAWHFHGPAPVVVAERAGSRIAVTALVRAIDEAILIPAARSITARVLPIAPRLVRLHLGPAVVIQRLSKQLSVFRYRRGEVRRWRLFGVATGQPIYPTPLGTFSIVQKLRDPWWYPPDSPWAQGEAPVPPGPGNPLGTRWMGLSVAAVGIHGTPDDASIGYSASHGCIRMHIPDAEWLFDHVRIGTPVRIDGS